MKSDDSGRGATGMCSRVCWAVKEWVKASVRSIKRARDEMKSRGKETSGKGEFAPYHGSCAEHNAVLSVIGFSTAPSRFSHPRRLAVTPSLLLCFPVGGRFAEKEAWSVEVPSTPHLDFHTISWLSSAALSFSGDCSTSSPTCAQHHRRSSNRRFELSTAKGVRVQEHKSIQICIFNR